jgi:hypothetical protein
MLNGTILIVVDAGQMAVEQHQMEAAQLVIDASEGNIELDVRSMVSMLAFKVPDMIANLRSCSLLLGNVHVIYHFLISLLLASITTCCWTTVPATFTTQSCTL